MENLSSRSRVEASDQEVVLLTAQHQILSGKMLPHWKMKAKGSLPLARDKAATARLNLLTYKAI
jgi:hypothetical protein